MKGNIYCIVDNTNYKYYIGSTTKNIGERLQNHEYNCNYYIQGKREYTTSYEIIQNNNYSIYLIKELEYDEDEEDQLLFLERNFIEDGWREGNCVNKYLPILSDEEKNEYHNEYQKEWYINNRAKIVEQRKQYYIENKDKFKERHKQYQIENKDKIKEQRKQYRNDNRDKINEKFTCPCGGKYTHKSKARHEKTITHQKYITSLSTI
jgi:DNA gyrase/topoisomerase IV subunit A